MIEAWRMQAKPQAAILFVIEDVTYNICDQVSSFYINYMGFVCGSERGKWSKSRRKSRKQNQEENREKPRKRSWNDPIPRFWEQNDFLRLLAVSELLVAMARTFSAFILWKNKIVFSSSFQRFHEFFIRERHPEIRVVRKTLTQIHQEASLGPNKELMM